MSYELKAIVEITEALPATHERAAFYELLGHGQLILGMADPAMYSNENTPIEKKM